MYYDNIPMVSVDVYPSHSLISSVIVQSYEMIKSIAQMMNKDVWTYIESYNVKNWNQNTTKMLRWHTYMGLSIGSKNIFYFQYGDASPNYHAEGDWQFGSLINWDYTKNPSWYDAQKLNKELLELAPIYNQYKSIGLYIENHDVIVKLKEPYSEGYILRDPYPYVNDIVEEFIDTSDKSGRSAYMLGIFNKKENENEYAFTMINMEDLNDNPYESDAEHYVKHKLKGEKATFYRNGKPQSVEKDADGYYHVNMANGFCWFVTVD